LETSYRQPAAIRKLAVGRQRQLLAARKSDSQKISGRQPKNQSLAAKKSKNIAGQEAIAISTELSAF